MTTSRGNWDVWADIDSLTHWLNNANGSNPQEISLRIMKIGEEFGEVISAHIGVTGQNPRKGVYGSTSDVQKELCDVIVTAMVALNSMTDDPAVSRGLFASHMTHLLSRIQSPSTV
jgi:hypothetical protein